MYDETLPSARVPLSRGGLAKKLMSHRANISIHWLHTFAIGLVFCAFSGSAQLNYSYDSHGNVIVKAATALAPPQILRQPQSQIVAPGELASFSIVMADTRGLSYQWRFNGTNIAGATTDALLLTNVRTTNDVQFSIVVTNSMGSVTSA